MRPNITDLIVKQDKCIGCGVCSTICPVDILPMRFNDIGLFQPYEQDGCLNKCTLCIDVCSFVDSNKNEKDIAKQLYQNETTTHHNDLGYFVSTYEIHQKDINERIQSASGGAGYSILKELLETKKVDAVLSVEPNDDPEKLFKFSVFKDIEQLQKIRGSVYYPTEISEVLDYVMQNDGSYAITVLPCYATSIRLAQEKNHKLRKRIKYLVGLVCGQMKTKEFTTQLGINAIGDKPLDYVKYRVKQENESANNFAFEFKGKDGSVGRLSWTAQLDGPAKMWGSRMFTPMACNSCTDVFAHCADIVLMDAWLPEYAKDYRGHTLVIVRNDEIKNMLENMKSIEAKMIDYKKVFLSQKPVVDNKNAIFYGSKNIFINKINKIKLEIQKLSNEGYEQNRTKIELLLMKIKKIEKIYKIINLPKRVIFKMYRILRGL